MRSTDEYLTRLARGAWPSATVTALSAPDDPGAADTDFQLERANCPPLGLGDRQTDAESALIEMIRSAPLPQVVDAEYAYPTGRISARAYRTDSADGVRYAFVTGEYAAFAVDVPVKTSIDVLRDVVANSLKRDAVSEGAVPHICEIAFDGDREPVREYDKGY
jgi:hypothetical protein